MSRHSSTFRVRLILSVSVLCWSCPLKLFLQFPYAALGVLRAVALTGISYQIPKLLQIRV